MEKYFKNCFRQKNREAVLITSEVIENMMRDLQDLHIAKLYKDSKGKSLPS